MSLLLSCDNKLITHPDEEMLLLLTKLLHLKLKLLKKQTQLFQLSSLKPLVLFHAFVHGEPLPCMWTRPVFHMLNYIAWFRITHLLLLYLSCRQFVVALFPLVTFDIPALLLGFSSSLMSLFESCFSDMFNHSFWHMIGNDYQRCDHFTPVLHVIRTVMTSALLLYWDCPHWLHQVSNGLLWC